MLRVTRSGCKKSIRTHPWKAKDACQALVLAGSILSQSYNPAEQRHFRAAGGLLLHWQEFCTHTWLISCLSAGKCQSQTEALARKFYCFQILYEEGQGSGQHLTTSSITLLQTRVLSCWQQCSNTTNAGNVKALKNQRWPGLQKDMISPPCPSNSSLNWPL